MISQNRMDDQGAFGAQYQLGNHRATYKRQFFAPSKLMGMSSIIGIFLYGILIITLVPFIENITILLVVPMLVIAGLLLLEGFLIFSRNRKQRVIVYDYGLIYTGPESLQTVLYWKNVHSVSHTFEETMWGDDQGNPALRSVYLVSCTNGMVLRLDETVAKVRHLGEFLGRETAQYLFPATLQTYQRGQPVAFGPLTVTQEGLSHQSNQVPWSEVKSINIFSGAIEIKRQGQRSIILGVPNSEVLKMLLQYVKLEKARQLFPAILNTYQMGLPVVFGPLMVTREGIFRGSALLPWSEVKSIKADEIYAGRLVIRKQRKRFVWVSMDLDAPHVEAFRMLMHHIRGHRFQQ